MRYTAESWPKVSDGVTGLQGPCYLHAIKLGKAERQKMRVRWIAVHNLKNAVWTVRFSDVRQIPGHRAYLATIWEEWS